MTEVIRPALASALLVSRRRSWLHDHLDHHSSSSTEVAPSTLVAAALADMAIAAVAVASEAIPEAIDAFYVAVAAFYGCCGRFNCCCVLQSSCSRHHYLMMLTF